MPKSPPPITDSAWYWVQLFCIAGLAALMLIGPKYSLRQTQIERNLQGRQLAARSVTEGQPIGPPPAARPAPAVPLWPLYGALTLTLVVAWTRLLRIYAARRLQESSE